MVALRDLRAGKFECVYTVTLLAPSSDFAFSGVECMLSKLCTASEGMGGFPVAIRGGSQVQF